MIGQYGEVDYNAEILRLESMGSNGITPRIPAIISKAVGVALLN
jgi:hypothetical protein